MTASAALQEPKGGEKEADGIEATPEYIDLYAQRLGLSEEIRERLQQAFGEERMFYMSEQELKILIYFQDHHDEDGYLTLESFNSRSSLIKKALRYMAEIGLIEIIETCGRNKYRLLPAGNIFLKRFCPENSYGNLIFKRNNQKCGLIVIPKTNQEDEAVDRPRQSMIWMIKTLELELEVSVRDRLLSVFEEDELLYISPEEVRTLKVLAATDEPTALEKMLEEGLVDNDKIKRMKENDLIEEIEPPTLSEILEAVEILDTQSQIKITEKGERVLIRLDRVEKGEAKCGKKRVKNSAPFFLPEQFFSSAA